MTSGRYASIPSGLKPAGTPGSQLLAIERKKASFDSTQMSEYLHGKEYLQRDAELIELLTNDPSGAFDKSNWAYLGRTDKFRVALKKDKRLAQLALEHGWNRETSQHAETLVDLPGPFGLHKTMFITTIDSMGTDEQKAKWLQPALNFEIIGCYAQTELGHGSNVQGIETMAVYDESKQEYDLHSPSMTASKWWIGGLGRSATHAIVMAQLVSGDQSRYLRGNSELTDDLSFLLTGAQGKEARSPSLHRSDQRRRDSRAPSRHLHWRHWTQVWLQHNGQRLYDFRPCQGALPQSAGPICKGRSRHGRLCATQEQCSYVRHTDMGTS
jgi:hypothetical protein